MGDGSVGNVFLDLVVRDTVNKQVENISNKATASAKKSFAGFESAIGASVNKAIAKISKIGEAIANGPANAMDRAAGRIAGSSQKVFQSVASAAASCGRQVETSTSKSFNRAVAMAQAKVAQLETALASVTTKLNTAKANDNDAAAQRLGTQQESIYDRLVAARQRLSIETQAAAQKEAAVQTSSSSQIKNVANSAFSAMRTVGQTAFNALGRVASSFRNIASRAFSGLRSMASGLAKTIGILKSRFATAGKTVGGFGSRLKRIVAGALVFNVLSRGLTNMVRYMGTAIGSSEKMQTALANLKGAAATAAAPLWDVLTPALTALANSAATALSYLSRLISFLTGKSVSAMSSAAKRIQSTAGAAKKAMASIAGFDEIQKLDSNDSSGGGGSNNTSPNFDFQGQNSALDAITASVQSGDWGQVGSIIAEKLNQSISAIPWPNILGKVQSWMQGIGQAINGFAGSFDFASLGAAISNGFNTLFSAQDTFLQTVDFGKIGSGIATGLRNALSKLDWKAYGKYLTNGLKSALEGLHGFVTSFNFSGLGGDLAAATMSAINNVDWAQAAADLSTAAIGLLTTLTEWISGINWQQLGQDIAAMVAAVDWNGLVTSLSEGIGAALGGLAALLVGLLGDAWNSVVEWWQKVAYKDGEFTMEGLLKGIGDVFANIGKWLKDNIFKPFIDGFKKVFDINSPSKVMEEQGGFIIAGLLNGIVAAWEAVVRFFEDLVKWFEDMFSGIADFAEGCWEGVKKTWSAVSGWFDTNIIQPVAGFFSDMWSGLTSGAVAAWEGVKSAFSSVASWFGKVFSKAWEAVKSVFSATGEVFLNIGDGILESLKIVVNAIISGLNTVIKGPFEGLNKILNKISKIDVAGVKPFSWLTWRATVPQIPMLAKGGVINQPTLAMMGEYAGAGSNPEIVTPQALMEKTMAGVMQNYTVDLVQCFEEVVAVLKDILEAVLGIEIDGEMLYNSVKSYRNKLAVSSGKEGW